MSLPSPGVRFGDGFLARLGAFAAQLSAAREREEVGRRRALQGEGQEFVGHRPYRAGEDLRRLDWDLFARLDRPYVFVLRSEAREAWTVVLDASASMGVGSPGKLQSAAETAAAIAALGLRLGARVTLVAASEDEQAQRFDANRTPDLGRALRSLEAVRAAGRGGLAAFVGGPDAPSRPPLAGRAAGGAGRVFLLGDFVDLDVASVLRLADGRRRIHLGQVLAPEEWDPLGWQRENDRRTSGRHGATWVDPETGARFAGAGESGGFDGYRRRLEAFVEQWSALAATHAITHRAWSSREPFETYLPDLLR